MRRRRAAERGFASLAAHRDIARVDDDQQIQQASDDEKRVAVLVRDGADVAGPVAERARQEIGQANAEVGERREADEWLRHVEREQASLDSEAERKHERQRDEEHEALGAAPEPEMSGARNRPRRQGEQDEPARLRTFGGGGAHDWLVYLSLQHHPDERGAQWHSRERAPAVRWRDAGRPFERERQDGWHRRRDK